MPTNDHLWTENEAARFLQVSVHSVKKYRQDGKLGFLRITNGAVRFDPEEVRRFVERGRVNPKCSCCGREIHDHHKVSLPDEASPDFPPYACNVAVEAV